jgi:uncharacterized protein (TIGR00369 family)
MGYALHSGSVWLSGAAGAGYNTCKPFVFAITDDLHRTTMKIKQPNSLHCFVCGIENQNGLKLRFYETGPGEVTVHHTVDEHFQGYPGVVHGGIVASMLDEALGRSMMGVDPENSRFMYTARLEIQYRKPVPVGKELTMVGRAGRRKNRSATASAAIYGPGGELLAEASAILVDIPPEVLGAYSVEELGWQVYPDGEEAVG